MTFLQRLLGQTSSLSVDEERFWAQSAGTMSNAGARVSADGALKISAAWACGRLIAETVAMLPRIVYRRLEDDAKERATGHPLYEILHNQPNRRQTSFEFVDMMQMHALFRGNGYAKIVSGPRGPVDRLIPIHPDRVEVEEVDEDTLRYRVTERDGSKRVYLDDEIFHLRGLSLDGVSGVSVITYARESLGLTLAAERYGAKLFANYSTPGGFLKHPGNLSLEAQQRLASQVEQMTGGENLHRLGVLEEGMAYQPVSFTPEDSQMLQTREFQAEDVCFLPGTLVITADGPKPIEEIIDGEMVLTHRGRWRPVVKAMMRPYNGEMVTVQAKGLSPVMATVNHPFYVQPAKPNRSHRVQAVREPEWLAAGELNAMQRTADGHRSRKSFQNLVMPTLKAEGHPAIDLMIWAPEKAIAENGVVRASGNGRATGVRQIIACDEALGWLIGLYVADGSTSDHQVAFYLGAHEQSLVELLQGRLKEVFGVESSTVQMKSVMRVTISNRVLHGFFHQFGNSAPEKRLPLWCQQQGDGFQRGLIDGLVAGDGGDYKQSMYVRTTSRALAWQLRLLLWANGINSGLEWSESQPYEIEGRRGKARESWIVRWHPNKVRRGTMGVAKEHVYFSLDVADRFKYCGPVYNLMVEEDETYTTVGGVVHNCRWFRVPPHMVGLTSKSTSWGSGIEEMSRGFVTYVLLPWLMRWQQLIDKDLIVASQTYFAEFLTDALLRGDISKRYSAYSIGRTGGWLATNEIRRFENMNPIEGGDDDYLTPLNMQKSNAVEEEQETEPVPAPESEPDPEPGGAHYEQLLRESAARVARKESAAMQRAAGRDAAAFEAAVRAFYDEGHADFVAQTMCVSVEAARAFVEAGKFDLIAGGADALTGWEARRASRLAKIAKEAG